MSNEQNYKTQKWFEANSQYGMVSCAGKRKGVRFWEDHTGWFNHVVKLLVVVLIYFVLTCFVLIFKINMAKHENCEKLVGA